MKKELAVDKEVFLEEILSIAYGDDEHRICFQFVDFGDCHAAEAPLFLLLPQLTNYVLSQKILCCRQNLLMKHIATVKGLNNAQYRRLIIGKTY